MKSRKTTGPGSTSSKAPAQNKSAAAFKKYVGEIQKRQQAIIEEHQNFLTARAQFFERPARVITPDEAHACCTAYTNLQEIERIMSSYQPPVDRIDPDFREMAPHHLNFTPTQQLLFLEQAIVVPRIDHQPSFNQLLNLEVPDKPQLAWGFGSGSMEDHILFGRTHNRASGSTGAMFDETGSNMIDLPPDLAAFRHELNFVENTLLDTLIHDAVPQPKDVNNPTMTYPNSANHNPIKDTIQSAVNDYCFTSATIHSDGKIQREPLDLFAENDRSGIFNLTDAINTKISANYHKQHSTLRPLSADRKSSTKSLSFTEDGLQPNNEKTINTPNNNNPNNNNNNTNIMSDSINTNTNTNTKTNTNTSNNNTMTDNIDIVTKDSTTTTTTTSTITIPPPIPSTNIPPPIPPPAAAITTNNTTQDNNNKDKSNDNTMSDDPAAPSTTTSQGQKKEEDDSNILIHPMLSSKQPPPVFKKPGYDTESYPVNNLINEEVRRNENTVIAVNYNDVQSSLLRLNILHPKPAMFPTAGVAEQTINRTNLQLTLDTMIMVAQYPFRIEYSGEILTMLTSLSLHITQDIMRNLYTHAQRRIDVVSRIHMQYKLNQQHAIQNKKVMVNNYLYTMFKQQKLQQEKQHQQYLRQSVYPTTIPYSSTRQTNRIKTKPALPIPVLHSQQQQQQYPQPQQLQQQQQLVLGPTPHDVLSNLKNPLLTINSKLYKLSNLINSGRNEVLYCQHQLAQIDPRSIHKDSKELDKLHQHTQLLIEKHIDTHRIEAHNLFGQYGKQSVELEEQIQKQDEEQKKKQQLQLENKNTNKMSDDNNGGDDDDDDDDENNPFSMGKSTDLAKKPIVKPAPPMTKQQQEENKSLILQDNELSSNFAQYQENLVVELLSRVSLEKTYNDGSFTDGTKVLINHEDVFGLFDVCPQLSRNRHLAMVIEQLRRMYFKSRK